MLLARRRPTLVVRGTAAVYLCLWRSSSTTSSFSSFGAQAFTSSSCSSSHSRLPATFLQIPNNSAMGSFFSSQSSGENSNSNMKGSGRPLPDFSAFAFNPASSSSSLAAAASAGDASTGKKRTRSASKKGDAADETESVAKPSPAKKAKTKSSPAKSPSAKAKAAPSTPKRTPKKSASVKTPGSSARKRTPRTPKIEPGSLDPPKGWEDIWSLAEELREDRSAPVDTDGGHELPERHRGEKVWRFQVLVALMLSSQTKDAVVGNTMRALQEHGLDVENIHATSAEDLNALINKVGFHNNKTKYLKQTCEILLEKYEGDIPPTAAQMMELPGVGPKMAYIVESVVFKTCTGIGVDTHMHRMFNDLKWVNSKTPEKTREQLEGWLPRDKWPVVNVLWVGVGQETQQQKEKIIKKAIASSRPADSLKLIRKLGVDLTKEGKRFGLEEEIKAALAN